MQVSVCLGAILIPEYLDSILAILLHSRNIFRNTFLFRNIPKRMRPQLHQESSFQAFSKWGQSSRASERETRQKRYRDNMSKR